MWDGGAVRAPAVQPEPALLYQGWWGVCLWCLCAGGFAGDRLLFIKLLCPSNSAQRSYEVLQDTPLVQPDSMPTGLPAAVFWIHNLLHHPWPPSSLLWHCRPQPWSMLS